MATALIRPHPLSVREQRELPLEEGLTLAEIVQLVWPAAVAREHAAVFVGADRVPPEQWARVRPKPGAVVRMALTLGGGDGDGDKQIVGVIAMIAIAVASQGVGAAAFGAGTFGASATAVGLTMAGSLALQAMFKPPDISTGKGPGSPAESLTYSFQAQANVATPYSVVPRLYGTHRIYPRIAAAPYATTEGANQFLYMLLDCGYGPLSIDQLLIGDTPLSNFRDTQYVIHPEWMAGDALEIYRRDTTNESLGVTLKTNIPEIRISAADAANIALEFAFPRGLVHFDDRGVRQPHTVGFSIGIRPLGSADPFENVIATRKLYSSSPLPTSVSTGAVTARAEDAGPRIFETHFGKGRTSLLITLGGVQEPLGVPPTLAVGDTIWFFNSPYLVTGVTPIGTAGTVVRALITPPLPKDYFAASAWCPVVRPSVDTIFITDATAQPLFLSINFDVEPGQWEIQVIRRSVESTDARTADVLNWLSLRSVAPRPVIATREPHTIIELKIRANDQLSGAVQNVNCIATAVLPVRAADGTWSDEPTRNPAWAYLDALRGNAALRPLADARIDFDALASWAAYCDAEVANGIDGVPEARMRFDHVVDYATTTYSLLQSIAAAGRATPTIRDGKHGVLVDAEQLVPVQLFTPRNSWGFNARRAYISEPNGMRVKFTDPLSWQEGEVVLYAAGFNGETAVTFEELKLFGVTRYTQATRDGRYMKAQALLRREQFEIQCDVESLIATRGDLVAVQHDVLEVGGDSTRVVALAGNDLTVADAFGALPVARYGLRIRLRDGTITPGIDAVPVAPDTWRLSVVPDPAPAEGDLLAWGFLTTETGDYLVKNVQPGADLTATLALVEVARGVYGADSGDIPPYVPPAGGRDTFDAPKPDRLRATQLDKTIGREPYADLVLEWDQPSGAAYSRFKIFRVDASGVETQIAESFVTSVQVAQNLRLLDPGVLTTAAVYSVIGIDATGKQSEPAFIEVQLLDPLFIPDAPGFLSSNVHDKTTTLTWLVPANSANPGNGQVLFYEVRWVPLDAVAPSAQWGQAARVTELLPWNVTTVTVPSRNGTYLVKSVTASRVESELAAVTVTAVEDLVMQDLFHSIDFDPAWAGLFDGTEVDAFGRLTLAPNADGTFPPYGVFQSSSRELFNQLLQCRITSRYEALGVNVRNFMASWVPLAIADPLAGARRGVDWDCSLWVNSAAGAPFMMADWVPLAIAAPLDPIPPMSDDDWRPLIAGEYTGRTLFFALVLESMHPNITPVVSHAGVDIDFPERQESYSDIAIPPGGIDFVFARPFVFPPSMAIDLQAAAPGDFVQRGAVGTDGLHIEIKNGAAAIAGVVDINAFGVGRQL